MASSWQDTKKLILWRILCGAVAWSINEPTSIDGIAILQVRNPTVVEQHIDTEDRLRVGGDLVVEETPLERVSVEHPLDR